MKGVRFYQEFAHKGMELSEGNVIAVLVANGWNPSEDGRSYDAIVAAYERPNCPPCSGSVTSGYLRARCKRVSEAQARKIHPALFTMLDEGGAP